MLCVTVFGPGFAPGVDELRVLALAAFGIVAVELLSSVLISQRKPLHASAAVAVAFLLTVVLNPLLIPREGGLGAAIARTLAYTAAGVVAALMFRHVLHGRLRDLLPRGSELPWFLRKVRGRFSGG